jgi:hypothetical protein
VPRSTAPPGGRRSPRGGTRYTGFRIRSGLAEWIFALFAVEYVAPWIVAFVLVPTAGQLMHAGWSQFAWSWLLAFALVLAGGPVGLVLEPTARKRSRSSRPAEYSEEAWRIRQSFWRNAPKVTGGLGLLTYHEAQRRGIIGRWRVAYAVAGVFVGLAVTLRAGLINRPVWPLTYDTATGFHWRWPLDVNLPWFVLYTVSAGLMCAALNIRNLQAVKGNGEEEDAPTKGHDLQELLKADAPITPKPGSRKVLAGGAAVEVKLHHPGETTDTIQAGLPKIVSTVGGLPREGHLVVPGKHPEDTTLTIVQRELLGESLPWPGPQLPGEYADVPARLGVTQDGLPLEIARFAATPGVTPRPKDPTMREITLDDWDTGNSLTMGMYSSGKTEGGMLEDAELMTRVGVVLWRSDTAKAGQTANDIRPAIDWLATSPEETYWMVLALGVYVEWASDLMGRHGFRRWSRKVWETLGIPALLVRFEEINNVVEVLGKHIIRRGEQVRSVGASIDASSQRADATNMPTGLRANLGMGHCYGVKDASDALFCLSESTLRAGADPGLWLNVQKGKCYLEAQHIQQTRWPVPARTFAPIPPQQMREHTARYAPRMAEMPTEWAERSASAQTPGAGRFYLDRSRISAHQWIEENGLLVPARAGRPSVTLAERPATTARMPTPEQLRAIASPIPPPPGVDLDAPTTRLPAPPEEGDDTDDQLTRKLDREENETVIASQTDPEIVDEIRQAHNRRGEVDRMTGEDVPPEEDVPLGDELPSRDMSTPEARNRALLDVIGGLFAGRPEDFVDVDSRTLIDAWAETGALNAIPAAGRKGSNRRNALSGRLLRLQEQGYVRRLEAGRGRKPAVYRIFRKLIDDRPPVDSEPDADDTDEE